MPPEAVDAAKSRSGWVVRFRRSDRFPQVSMPAWAQDRAAAVVEGAKVRMGKLGSNSLVETIRIPLDAAADEDEATEIAERIAGRVEG